MEDIEKLVKTTLSEIEKLLTTRSVVGEPITVDGNTVIVLSSFGFGFGAGGGSGKDSKTTTREGAGGGTGGGGGIKPVAVVIVGKDGVRVDPFKRGSFAMLEKVGEVVVGAIEKRRAHK